MNRNPSSTIIWVKLISKPNSKGVRIRINNLEVTEVTNNIIEDFARSFNFNHTIFDPLAENHESPRLTAYP